MHHGYINLQNQWTYDATLISSQLLNYIAATQIYVSANYVLTKYSIQLKNQDLHLLVFTFLQFILQYQIVRDLSRQNTYIPHFKYLFCVALYLAMKIIIQLIHLV